jgi:chemotaxis protein MotB
MGKKKDEHHGGAWKVAYADFVTAMMALFIVLWIIAPEPNNNKIVYEDEIDTAPPPPPDQGAQGGDAKAPGEKNMDKAGEGNAAKKKKDLQFIADEIIKLLKIEESDPYKPVDVKLVNDTIKVSLFDRARKPFFKSNSSELTEWGDFVLKNLAMITVKNDMRLLLDGHTAKIGRGAPMPTDYSPWELSADRAAASRRRLLGLDVKPEQVVRITGYADTRPIEKIDPTFEHNQRLTVHMGIQ